MKVRLTIEFLDDDGNLIEKRGVLNEEAERVPAREFGELVTRTMEVFRGEVLPALSPEPSD